MKEYQIFSDSSCDLPEVLVNEHKIKVIPFYVTFDKDNYYKENTEITNEAFYDKLSQKNMFSITKFPTVQDYTTEFKRTLEEGKDIVCICLSNQLSGSYQNAVYAKEVLDEQFPDANVYIIDSFQATAGQGLLLLQLAYMKKAGFSLEAAVHKLELIRTTSRIIFTVDKMTYFEKGRIMGKVAALARSMFGLKPLIQLKDAELVNCSSARGRDKALQKVLTMVEEYFIESNEKPSYYDFCIVNATTEEEAAYLRREVEHFIRRAILYPVFQIGVTIGSYTGSGGIGISFIKKYNYVFSEP